MATIEQSYQSLLERFGDDNMSIWLDSLYTAIDIFIERDKLGGVARIDERKLLISFLDFLDDLFRIKDFHGIDNLSYEKICSYLAYWISRRKPIRMNIATESTSEYANERFCVHLLLHFSNKHPRKIDISNEQTRAFIGHLQYHLLYRHYTAQTLELAVVGWNSSFIST